MFKKAVHFTRPPQARLDVPLPGQAAVRRTASRISDATFVRARELVSGQCLCETYLFSPAHREPARTASFPGLYVGPSNDARCARRGITRLMFAHGREVVSAQCLRKLAAFFNILLDEALDGIDDRSCADAVAV